MPNARNRLLMSAIGAPIFMIAIVFVTAGTLDYWQGMLYTALTLTMLVVNGLALRKNPELISERLKPGDKAKSWDRTYWGLSTLLFFSGIILACLDGGRFKLSPSLPVWVYLASSFVFVFGNLFFIWAKATNRFFSSVVRIQKERGHTVCQEGPYKYIRHPGYLGGLLFTLATPLLLGSLWAMIPTVTSVLLMIVRTVLEDRTLAIELDGYKEYMARVKYRLVPNLW